MFYNLILAHNSHSVGEMSTELTEREGWVLIISLSKCLLPLNLILNATFYTFCCIKNKRTQWSNFMGIFSKNKKHYKNLRKAGYQIGPHTYVGKWTGLGRPDKIKIGDYCCIANNVYFNPSTHPTNWLSVQAIRE